MDLYMPGCNGIELAKVIRQMDGFLSTPIVYLSSENDFNTQFESAESRGDDFLVRPLIPGTWFSGHNRAWCVHVLYALWWCHDGLTSLLNHTALKEELVREVVRSIRLDTPMSFALVDIDFFTKVNNKYGHAAGDRVIKSLSRLLKQRLPEQILSGVTVEKNSLLSWMISMRLRLQKWLMRFVTCFRVYWHLSQEEEFSVSFSCGIADLAHFPDAASLSEAGR